MYSSRNDECQQCCVNTQHTHTCTHSICTFIVCASSRSWCNRLNLTYRLCLPTRSGFMYILKIAKVTESADDCIPKMDEWENHFFCSLRHDDGADPIYVLGNAFCHSYENVITISFRFHSNGLNTKRQSCNCYYRRRVFTQNKKKSRKMRKLKHLFICARCVQRSSLCTLLRVAQQIFTGCGADVESAIK